MKAHIKNRLLQIALCKLKKTEARYPDMTGAYLTPIETKLLLESGKVKSTENYNDMIDYHLKKIPLGISSPTNIYFYNKLADEYVEKLRKIAQEKFNC